MTVPPADDTSAVNIFEDEKLTSSMQNTDYVAQGMLLFIRSQKILLREKILGEIFPQFLE